MNVTQVDYGLIPGTQEPDQLLELFPTLTQWSESLLTAGASRVSVVQRFHTEARITRQGVEYVFCSSVRRLHQAARRLAPDVLHVNGLGFPVQTWRLRQAVGSRAIVIQDHAAGEPPARIARPGMTIRRAVWRAGLGAADAFFFTAPAQADAWKHAGLIRPEQVVFGVLEAGTSMKPLQHEKARAASLFSGNPAALWVGRLDANKDPITVLAGFERMADAFPGATLTMIHGSDDLLPQVRAELDSSPRLKGRVRLVGAVPHAAMAAFFSGADIFVLGSHHEGSGFALLEACACGTLPVVADNPAFRAIAGEIGELWPIGDADACGRALIKAAQTPDWGASRARTRAHFDRSLSWPVVAAKALAAYEAVAMQHR
ncbi:MAG TPA: glycosyltransferase family 4 protein [Vicinamibacterales bacterium]|nr:glycosyltransferase family 4 protein [Vicinamibacterales bacterium]